MVDAEKRNYERYEREVNERAENAERGRYALGSSVAPSAETTRQVESEVRPIRRRASRLLGERLSRREIRQDEEVEQIGEREQRAIDAIRGLIWHNFMSATRENRRLEREEADSKLVLRVLENETEDFSKNDVVIAEQMEHIRSIAEQREDLAKKTPESHTLVHGLELREHSRQVKNGEMVTTPYVEEHLRRVERNIREGRPTFIHGHLGSGKTELAINASRRAAIDRVAYEEALKDYDAFADSHLDASAEECTAELGRAYRRHLMTFEKALRDGDPAAHERFAPLIISGSKDLTSQDLYADKTLKLTKFNGKALLEHKEDLDAEIRKWQSEHPEEAKDSEKARAAANEILELFKLKNQAFGTEVEIVKQAIYRGVEEGRPVIIDEVNAIPSAILISLNDVLQRRPGDNCYVPGVGPVRIKPGFAITMTGNLSSNKINYTGTDDLNPAFLSRLDIIEHDYLPMSETGNVNNQVNPERNELFHVIISYLADTQGNLRLPEMDKSLEEIFSLCQLAHETQSIFGGKRQSSITMDSGEEIDADLEKSVLSMRNVLNVLKEWRKGLDMDLDKALFDGFIAGVTNADDQNLILALARKYGFFSENDGYQIKVKERGAGFTTWEEIHPGKYEFRPSPFETMSSRKVVELLYGPGPEREVYPEDVDLGELANEGDDEMTVEDLEGFEKQKEEFGQIIEALKALGERCGCTV